MSIDNVYAVIGRVIRQPEFQKLFFSDLTTALTEYELTDDEVAALSRLTRDSLSAIVGKLVSHQIVPIRVGRSLVIIPADLQPSPLKPTDLPIYIAQDKTSAVLGRDGRAVANDGVPIAYNSGRTFGSGVHSTTHLALIGIERTVRSGDVVLDIGCGSGILSIAAARLGASKMLALDVDANAVRIAGENLQRNNLEGIIRVEQGSLQEALRLIASDAFPSPQVVAVNIIAPVIIKLLEEGLADVLGPQSVLIVSGIASKHMIAVRQALTTAGLQEAAAGQLRDWVAIAAAKQWPDHLKGFQFYGDFDANQHQSR